MTLPESGLFGGIDCWPSSFYLFTASGSLSFGVPPSSSNICSIRPYREVDFLPSAESILPAAESVVGEFTGSLSIADAPDCKKTLKNIKLMKARHFMHLM